MKLFVGVDIGSTTAKCVIVDENDKMLVFSHIPTEYDRNVSGEKILKIALDEIGASETDIAYLVSTGYGRKSFERADLNIPEIIAHGMGTWHMMPGTRTIIDIGGQDSKVICLDEAGAVSNFLMNDKCAAGTGRFLELMARTLELDLEEMGTAGLDWKEDLTISSMCTVFAESEVVSLIADNKSTADIVHGLNKSVASRTASMAARAGGRGPYRMTGGVARNRGVVRALEECLGEPLRVSELPDLCGALGAALFALEGG